MAFVRRKGNSFYLVHNVRRGEKVQQLHLARLGQRARSLDQRQLPRQQPALLGDALAQRGACPPVGLHAQRECERAEEHRAAQDERPPIAWRHGVPQRAERPKCSRTTPVGVTS